MNGLYKAQNAVLTTFAAIFVWLGLPGKAYGSNACSGILDLDAVPTHQFLHTPNYPFQYVNNELCRWRLTVTTDYEVVHMKVTDSHLEDSATCGSDYGDVKDGPDTWDRTMKSWCGEGGSIIDKVFVSNNHAMLVSFRSNKAVSDRGFQVEYWSEPKAQTNYLPANYGIINFVLFGIFGVIMGGIIICGILIALIRKRNKAFQSKMAAVAEAAKGMAAQNAAFVRSPSRGSSSARTRICSVSSNHDVAIALTPV